jgi:hypothetical protein
MRILTSSFVLAAAMTLAMPAAAQGPQVPQVPQGPRSERPYRGLFAGGTGAAEQLLTLSASFGGGYDDDIFGSGPGGSPPPPSSNVTGGGSSSYVAGSAQLGYSLSKAGVAFSASGGSGAGHYPGLSDPTVIHHNASVGASFQVARHATFSVGQIETYQPFYFFAWLPHDITPTEVTPVFDPGTMTIADAVQAASLGTKQPIAADAVAAQHAEYYLSSETNAGFTQGLSQRTNLSLGYAYRRSDSQSGARDFESQSAGGSLSYALGKGLSLKGGYGYSINEYPLPNGTVERFEGHTIDGGVNYNKALSVSRRTTLGFQTGMAAVSDGLQTHYNVVGNIQLTREIGRSWASGVAYSRNVSYAETFRAPVLSDNVVGGINGLFSRTVQFAASAGASRGNVGYVADNDLESYFATTSTRFAFTRKTGLSVYYAYNRYSFANGIVLPPGISRFTNRQSFGFSVDTWVPLIQRNRRANATR